ncbi:DUF58 domain-containing protein [Stutzerimonas stutzeri]|uniref:DUF58 domain-containing protein n=1 Tax=Stutzerimonas stutzeri TaxID=316 RepID=UPI001C2E9D90|nr:DUF58 domain-containing protein [Stutzerimonas stutzeri]
MTPSRRSIVALVALLGLALALGVLSALGHPLPDAVHAAWWGLLLCLGALAAIDAVAVHRLPSPSLQRVLNGYLALGRWHEVQLQISAQPGNGLRLDVFDHAPSALSLVHLPQRLTLGAGHVGTLRYRVCPRRRGHYRFEQCEIGLYGPLGLWRQRRLLPLASQTRVYPDFTRLHGASLMAVDSWLGRLGVRQQPRRGLGLEFHQLREFREGDTLRQIDWKATARKHLPIAREYQDDRDQQILLMLDCGRRMRSMDGTRSHFDHALDASLLLAYVALRQGDALGFCSFASEQPRFLAPAKGPAQLNLLLNGVYDLINTRQPADFTRAAAEVLTRQKRRALVVILSNLRDEDDEDLLAAVRLLASRHRVLLVSLREPVLDVLRQHPVVSRQEALDYCGTLNYLTARERLHDRLRARGVPVLDALPQALGPALISRYLAWKKNGTL